MTDLAGRARGAKIIVVGAGPAGMMAAIRAAQRQAQVILIEKNPTLGNKLLLSGKGRCNLTNTSSLEEFLRRFSHHGDFLRDAFKRFFHQELMGFFQKRGLKLKIERQKRVFPLSDKANSILQVLQRELQEAKVEILYQVEAKDVLSEGTKAVGVLLKGGETLWADKVILATGGVSYRFTGSTGDGLAMARRLGHSITALRPGLVPLESREKFCCQLRGLTLKNIRLKFSAGRHRLTSEIGELVFTDFGISGPLVLSASGQISEWLSQGEKVSLAIDLKPALSEQQLKQRLLREFRINSRKSLRNTLKALLPLRLIDIFIERLGISPDEQANQVSQAVRQKLIALLKDFPLQIKACRPLEEAIVTRGGVSLKEINPRTMESRRVKGLYFCGEMIDLDADTGGFNLQAAFSTGYLAGESAVKTPRDKTRGFFSVAVPTLVSLGRNSDPVPTLAFARSELASE